MILCHDEKLSQDLLEPLTSCYLPAHHFYAVWNHWHLISNLRERWEFFFWDEDFIITERKSFIHASCWFPNFHCFSHRLAQTSLQSYRKLFWGADLFFPPVSAFNWPPLSCPVCCTIIQAPGAGGSKRSGSLLFLGSTAGYICQRNSWNCSHWEMGISRMQLSAPSLLP